MPSPFPGMNPYFEQPDLWRGFHNLFLGELVYAISPQVSPRYYVEVEESIYIDVPPVRKSVADVAVTGPESGARGPAGGTLTVEVGAPVTATLPRLTRRKRRWLTVRDAKSRAVVTVIELFSPSDKTPGADRDRYLGKRDRILRSSANLVELDLLRGGHRMPADPFPACDYCVLVSRRPERPRAGLWPFRLRDPLPAVPVPLRAGEPEPTVALKAVLDRVYDGARYADRIYDGQPDPPLSGEDAEWARQVLAAAPPTPAR